MKLPFKREHRTPEEGARRDALRVAQSRLKDAEKAHGKRVKGAQKVVNQTDKDYERAVSAAEKALHEAGKSRKLGTLAGVTLYDDKIVTSQGTAELTPEVRADVDTAGALQRSSRVTATRLVTMGVFAFAFKKKKTDDSRELYLAVETPDFMSVQQINANLSNAARSFVASIATAAKQAEQTRTNRANAVEAAKEKLQRVRDDRSAIETARRALDEAEHDTAEIERCQAEVAPLEQIEASSAAE
jgi:hypothetical protein